MANWFISAQETLVIRLTCRLHLLLITLFLLFTRSCWLCARLHR
ncbi:hypothetical protein D046_1582, partial [Vibrio parahaemolyticus V-223/04]